MTEETMPPIDDEPDEDAEDGEDVKVDGVPTDDAPAEPEVDENVDETDDPEAAGG